MIKSIIIPLAILPQYRCPSPGIRKESKTAGKTFLFFVLGSHIVCLLLIKKVLHGGF